MFGDRRGETRTCRLLRQGQLGTFQDLFDEVSWEDVGPFRVGGVGLMRIVPTTHFSGYGFNTDKQLQDLPSVAFRTAQR